MPDNFSKLIIENKMTDAKRVFEKTMQDKMSSIVANMRKEVAKSFFNKSEQK
jgi:hypothetical protein